MALIIQLTRNLIANVYEQLDSVFLKFSNKKQLQPVRVRVVKRNTDF